MPWTALQFAPGIIRNTTRYATAGTWYDGSLVRFRDGYPERWAGWADTNPGYIMFGMCRSLHRHGDLAGNRWISLGTSSRFYMKTGEFQHDVTPFADIVDLTNPFATTAGSNVVVVTDMDHRRHPGDTVFISGVDEDVGGIPANDIGTPSIYDPPLVTDPGKEHVITGWVDENRYEITVATNAIIGETSGGTIKAIYLFRAGNNDVAVGGGWGRLGWSEGDWDDQPSDFSNVLDQLGIWSQDNWGEDIVANALSGPIFYWDASDPAERMVNILDLPGADGHAPLEAEFIVVSHRDRHLLAFGATKFGGVEKAPMAFRWCSQEAITNWNQTDMSGTAGDLPLSNGSKFISAIATNKEIMVWTDQALYSVQYIGPPLIYTADLIDRWADICGLKSCCSHNGVIYWMGQGGFYAYTGRTEKIPCPVWDYIKTRLNTDQMAKVYGSSNQAHNEVLWFYPSNISGNLEIDSYVAYDVAQQVWSFGSLPRTAWMDLDAISPPVATEPGPVFRLFEHDHGMDDGSTSPPSPLIAYLESGPFELSSEGSYDKGDKMMFVRRILPDVTFRDTTETAAPRMNIILKMMDKPGGGFADNSSSQVQRSATIPVEQFTTQADVRLRGRSLTFRAESNSAGSAWRLGVPRIDARTDGQR